MLSKKNLRVLLEVKRKLDKYIESATRDKITKIPEKKMEKAFVTYFDKQGKALIKALGKYRSRFSESISDDEVGKALLAAAPLKVALEKVVVTQTGIIMQDAAVQTVKDLGLNKVLPSINVQTTSAIEYLEAHAAELVSGIDDTTRATVKRIIVDGAKSGKNYGQVSEELKAQFDIFKVGKPQQHIRSRAEFIATNESRVAYETASYSTVNSIEDEGIEMQKRWVTVGDNRVSEGCADNESEGWIGVKEEFGSGHLYPPRFPSCRCDVEYQRKSDSKRDEERLRKLAGLDVKVVGMAA